METTNQEKIDQLVDKIPIKMKLAALWIGLTFLYVYADIITFFRAEILHQIVSGKVTGIVITQGFLFSMSVLMSIPALMVVFSLLLKRSINRVVNIVLGAAHILLAITTLFTPG